MPEHLPRLQSGPVVLRDFTFRDLALIQGASTDALIPLITSVPTTPDAEAARALVERQHARVPDGDGYSFAIADATNDEALGQIGLRLSAIENGRVCIGYWVAARHRGRGVARHALQAISDWGSTLPGVHRLEPWASFAAAHRYENGRIEAGMVAGVLGWGSRSRLRRGARSVR